MNDKSYKINQANEYNVCHIQKDVAGWTKDFKLVSLAWYHDGIGSYCELYSETTGKIIAKFKQKHGKA